MRIVLDYLLAAWSFKLSLVPVLTTYFLFDLPAVVRRITRRAYIPIYFMFFPLGHSDEMYAQYFNDDDMFGIGASMTAEQKETLRTRIQIKAIISMIFATVAAPWLCGLFAAFYLSASQFAEFVWFLAVIKSTLLCWSLYNIYYGDTFITRTNSVKYIAAVYFVYLVLIIAGVVRSYTWSADQLATAGVLGLAWGLAGFIYTDMFINIIVVSLGTWAITNHYLDPRQIREVLPYENSEREQGKTPSA